MFPLGAQALEPEYGHKMGYVIIYPFDKPGRCSSRDSIEINDALCASLKTLITSSFRTPLP